MGIEQKHKNILIVAYQSKRFLDLYNFAEDISKEKSINIVFYINNNIQRKFYSLIDSSKFDIINRNKIDNNSVKKKNSLLKIKVLLKKIPQFLKDIVLNSSLYSIYQERKIIKQTMQQYIYFYSLLKDNKIDSIIISGDRPNGCLEAGIIKAANELNIKIILPYLVYYAEYEDLIKKKQYQEKTYNLYDYIVLKKLKEYTYKNKLYHPTYYANALYKLGVLSKNGWFMGKARYESDHKT